MERQWTREEEELARRVAMAAFCRFMQKMTPGYRALIDQDAYIGAAHYGVVRGFNTYDPARGAKLANWMYVNAIFEMKHHDRDDFPGGGRRFYNRQDEAVWTVSLDALCSEEGDLFVSPALATDGGLPDFREKLSDRALRWLEILDEKRRRVLEMRFLQEMTQEQVARVIGCSQMHVSRLERQALERIRALVGVEPCL
jgi:RNA polymerase sigma factor (sigma-70 family)